jgi:60 kDa SS-A/Ro ribonucleoprotein
LDDGGQRRRTSGTLPALSPPRNESWADAIGSRQRATPQAWARVRRPNTNARLVLLDLQPSTTTQAVDREDVLDVGGLPEEVFGPIAAFGEGRLGSDHITSATEGVVL